MRGGQRARSRKCEGFPSRRAEVEREEKEQKEQMEQEERLG